MAFPGFWLNLQQRWDLYHASRGGKKVLQRIKPVCNSEAA